jgi:hypothetical protein
VSIYKNTAATTTTTISDPYYDYNNTTGGVFTQPYPSNPFIIDPWQVNKTVQEPNMALMDSYYDQLKKQVQQIVDQERANTKQTKFACEAKVAKMEQLLMDINLALSAFAVAVATGDIEKVRACLPDLEKALEPINRHFREKIEQKMEPKQEAEEKASGQYYQNLIGKVLGSNNIKF